MESAQFLIEAKDEASGVLQDITGFIGGAMQHAVGNILSGAFDTATQAIGEFFGGALEAEKGLAKFQNTLRLAGEKANFTEGQALELADKFKNLAGGSDDAIIAIQEMGLRMDVTGSEMESFIQNTLDLGAVTGSTENAAFLLQLAHNDVTAAMSRARRAGILLTEAEQEQIKALDKEGKSAEATALFMDILASKTEGMAETLSQTTGAKLAAFQERLADVGEEALMTVLPALNAAFDGIAPIIEDVASALGGGFKTAVEELGPKATELKDSVVVLLGKFSDMLGLDFSGFDLDTVISDTIDGAGKLIDKITELTDLLSANMPESVDEAKEAIWNLFPPEVQAGFLTAQQVLTDIGESIATTLTPSFTALADALGPVWEKIQPLIAPTIGIIFATLGAIILALVGIVVGLANAVAETVTVVIDNFGTLTSSWGATFSSLSAFLSGFVEFWKRIFEGDIPGAISQAKENLFNLGSFIGNLFSSIVLTVGAGIETMLAAVGGFVSGVVDFFTNLYNDLIGHSIIPDIVDGMITAFTTAFSDIVSKVSKFVTDMIDAFKGFLPKALQFGIDFANNIILGVLQMAGQIAQVAYDVVSGAVKSAASALGGAAAAAAGATAAPPRAGGGAVHQGGLYTVGEHGPELFAPGQSGAIIPGGMGGNNISISIDGAGDPQAVARAVIYELRRRDLIPATSL